MNLNKGPEFVYANANAAVQNGLSTYAVHKDLSHLYKLSSIFKASSSLSFIFFLFCNAIKKTSLISTVYSLRKTEMVQDSWANNLVLRSLFSRGRWLFVFFEKCLDFSWTFWTWAWIYKASLYHTIATVCKLYITAVVNEYSHSSRCPSLRTSLSMVLSDFMYLLKLYKHYFCLLKWYWVIKLFFFNHYFI